jgi:hypothetical protein
LHVTLHDPLAHEAVPFPGDEHVTPQPPQFDVLVVVFTHAPLQFDVPVEQHTPDEQLVPAAQAFPHDPQFDALVERLTHTPPQLVCPVGQQIPPDAVYPLLQVMPHVPVVHVADPFAGTGHAVPHDPQLVTLVERFAHVPLQLV